MSHRLADPELLAFAGLARVLFRLDGTFTEAERDALEKVSRDLLGHEDAAPGPYRTAPDATATPVEEIANEIWSFIERAAEALPDEDAVQQSALEVTNPVSRQMIFAALSEIAASDAITQGEWSMLEWLEEQWELG